MNACYDHKKLILPQMSDMCWIKFLHVICIVSVGVGASWGYVYVHIVSVGVGARLGDMFMSS